MDKRLSKLGKAMSETLMKVTDFNPKLRVLVMGALSLGCRTHITICNGPERLKDVTFILAGSVAELDIRPLMFCNDDIDLMFYTNIEWVVQSDTETFSSIPSKSAGKDRNVFRMEPTKFPGYVTLYHTGNLLWNSQYKTYSFVKACFFASPPIDNGMPDENKSFESHGPALRTQYGSHTMYRAGQRLSVDLKLDLVPCKPCSFFPSEYISRERSYTWPMKHTIETIAIDGCDVVNVPHPSCRNPVDPTQWRLSFSRAEIALIHTWSNEQKLIYHMLRYFWKHCNLSGVDLISTYHLKTLMFWNCEEHSSDYWDSTRLMHIISDLILWLLQCLGCRRLSNYFIPDCNLLDNEGDINDPDKSRFGVLVLNLLPYTKVENLIDWFLRNYLLVALEEYPVSSSQAARDARFIHGKFDIYASSIDNVLDKCVHEFDKSHQRMLDVQMCIWTFLPLWDNFVDNPNMCRLALQMLPIADIRFMDYYRSYVLLNAANDIQMNEPLPSHWLIDIIAQVAIQSENLCSQYRPTDDYGKEQNAESYFRKALCLLQIRVECNGSAIKDLLLLLSKCCLEKSLKCGDSSAVFCVAALYYIVINDEREELRRAIIDLCEMFPPRRDHSSCGRYRTECRFIQSLGFSNTSLLTAIEKWSLMNRDAAVCHTPNIFDCVLMKLYLNMHLKETPKKIMAYSRVDFCDFVFHKRPFAKVESSNDSVKQLLFNSLLELSAQYLTVFNEALQQDEEISKYCPVTQQYMAMHHFRCGNFELALEKCEQIIQFWEHHRMKTIDTNSIFHVILNRPFNLLLDDTIRRAGAEYASNDRRKLLIIHSSALALYIKTECFIKLAKPMQKSVAVLLAQIYFFEKLHQEEMWSLSRKIVNLQRQTLLKIHKHKMEEVSFGKIEIFKDIDRIELPPSLGSHLSLVDERI